MVARVRLFGRCRLLERLVLRSVLAGFFVLNAGVSVYVWTDRSTATDWEWAYRVLLPVSAAAMLWGVLRPRIAGLAELFLPLMIAAVVRLVDFVQDWFITPSPVEPVDLFDRALLGSFGWGMTTGFVLLTWTLERLLLARFEPSAEDGDLAAALCMNAPGCPRHQPVPRSVRDIDCNTDQTGDRGRSAA